MNGDLYTRPSAPDSRDLLYAEQPAFPARNRSADPARDVLMALRSLPLFSRLSDDQFKQVAALLHSDVAKQGQLIYEIGGRNTNLYILRRGRVALRWTDQQDIERRQVVMAGGVFNELAFLTGVRCRDTAEALEPSTKLWYLPRKDFQELLSRHPEIKSRLVYSQEALDVLEKLTRIDWLRPDETVIVFAKRHWWVFARLALMTTAAVILLLGLLAFTAAAQILGPLLLLAIGLIVAPAATFLIWSFIDWQNDFFAVTDQRVVHRERVLLIRDDQDEIPLNRVQDVIVVREGTNILQTIVFVFLDIGNIIIEAQGAQSRIVFDDIGKPDDISYQIFVARARALSATHLTERAKIRAELRRELGLAPREPIKSIERKSTRPKLLRERLAQIQTALRRLRQTLLPRMRLVEGNQVTYRKHWLVLLQRAGLQFVLWLTYTIAVVILWATQPDVRAVLTQFVPAVIVSIVGVGLFAWFVWEYEDWRNDIYILTPDRIIDSKRSPFGLRGTQRRDAGLGAVQNVTAATRGVIDLLFDMGDVTVRTGGAEGALVFERVYNPRQVQREITVRLEAYAASQRAREAAQRNRELAEWIAIYDDLRGLHKHDSSSP
ncbi:MAG: cyclic nucleotide-binding domain-containing protein [Anaerolineae bacterium]|nr:cyclic nucleotide-binding domain-containing protein [Thermoflexales bacterium]MDW8406213.1 cyclic nucleotide-binding domain-containing protein [Anaerolineae bacterium]